MEEGEGAGGVMWAEGTPVRIDTGVGTYVDMTIPGVAVRDAFERTHAAITGGGEPDPIDIATVKKWLDGQEETFGNLLAD